MSGIFISGIGAVSPAGWGIGALRDAIVKGFPLPRQALGRPGTETGFTVLRVPPPSPRPPFLAHARLRRASPISHFALGSALEALGPSTQAGGDIAVIACVFSGCVNYSRRFYAETLADPATASPLLFPETVFNAPASHLSACLGSSAINYTLVGDTGTMLTALALGARWLLEGKAGRCVVVGMEEVDWLTAGALRLFDRSQCLSEGAGAIVLTRSPAGALARLECVTDEYLYGSSGKTDAVKKARAELDPNRPGSILFDSVSGEGRFSRAEREAWADWAGPRVACRKIAGEGLMASAAWQLVLAADAIATGRARASIVSIAGFHQHAVAARLVE